MTYDLTYPRSRGLGLLGDEEDEEMRRRAASIAALQPTAAMDPGPLQPRMSALLQAGDPDMDARWRAAEMSALERSAPEHSYGVGEGIRDFAPMAIGGVLDVLLNKGRGLGVLAAGGTQALSMERSRRDAAKKLAHDQALAARRQREAGADMGIQAEHARLRAAELQHAQDQLAYQRSKVGDPELARRAQEAQIRLQESQANENEASANLKWTADPNARTDTPEDLELRRAQAEKLRAETHLLRNPQLKPLTPAEQRAQRKEDAEATELEQLRMAPPGIKINNPDLWDAGATQDKVARRKLFEGIKAYQSATRAAQRMAELRQQHGTEFETLGGSATSEYGTLGNELMAQIGVAANAGVLQPSDIDRFRALVPDLGPKWNDVTRLWGDDRTLGSIQGIRAGIRGSADAKATAGGFEYDYAHPVWMTEAQLKAAEAKRSRQPTAAGPEAPTVPDSAPRPRAPMGQRFDGRQVPIDNLEDVRNETLPTTPGGRSYTGSDTPDFPGGAQRFRAGNGRAQALGNEPMPGGTMNATPIARQLPDGSFDIDGETYTADEVAKLRRKGVVR